ncbi:hypothetical protein [Acrocarpospora sp. B8E8]|uniref:hypothetical protein n=1 Tax=Acrocarpospora sp. B8E8 TaxID=3153572 RepID=UPI00325EC56A
MTYPQYQAYKKAAARRLARTGGHAKGTLAYKVHNAVYKATQAAKKAANAKAAKKAQKAAEKAVNKARKGNHSHLLILVSPV